jgi:hypothetical protein
MPLHGNPSESWQVRRAGRADPMGSLEDELQARETARLFSERRPARGNKERLAGEAAAEEEERE